MRQGASLFLEPSFAYPAKVQQRIDEEAVTVFPGVPTVFTMLLSLDRRTPLRFPSVTKVTCAGGALLPSVHDGMRTMFPAASIIPMYGQTECMRVSYLDPTLVADKPTSCGKAIPGTETVVLSDDGTPVAPGEIGILHVRGPHVTEGYFRDPERTSEILRDGPLPGEKMLCTHDLFRTDEDGFLYFVGRSDEIVKTRGEKVSPVEVEDALHAIDGVREAAVVGVPDEVLGEAVRAYVVLEHDTSLSETRPHRRVSRFARGLQGAEADHRARRPPEDPDRKDHEAGARSAAAVMVTSTPPRGSHEMDERTIDGEIRDFLRENFPLAGISPRCRAMGP